MTTLNELSLNVTNLQSQFSAFTTTLGTIQRTLQLVATQQQLTNATYPADQRQLAPREESNLLKNRNQLAAISTPHNSSSPNHMQNTPLGTPTASESPEKKKHKAYETTDVMDIQTRLFTDVHYLADDTEMTDPSCENNSQHVNSTSTVEDAVDALENDPSQQSLTQGPPDARNNNQSDLAGPRNT
jgi:hypothetical protein